jgi:hypothetical protein
MQVELGGGVSMTTRLSRERASSKRERALDNFPTRESGLAGIASTGAPVRADAAIDALPASLPTSLPTTVPTSTRRRELSTRVSRLRARRARGARWRRTSAAFGAVVFAGLGSVTLASSSAVATTNPEPNSVQAFGSAPQLGSSSALRAGVVGIANDPTRHGYWLVGADGGVFAFGQAAFFGSTGSDHLNAPIVGMAASPTGRGYWLVGADGGVFAFGDASYEGSMADVTLAAPITALVPTTDGHGYWLVGADGGVFAFGNAHFHGSAVDLQLASPIVGAAGTTSGHGYWLVGADGGIFAYGDALFHGSQLDSQNPVVGIAAEPAGNGYWVARADGSVSGFGTPAAGNASTLDPATPHPNTVGIAASAGGGYWLAEGAIDQSSSLANDPFLACTRGHESDRAGGYQAVSSSGTYRGAYQFDQSTWNSAAQLAGRDDLVGVDPSTVAPADQDLLAMSLFHARGAAPWGNRCRGLT